MTGYTDIACITARSAEGVRSIGVGSDGPFRVSVRESAPRGSFVLSLFTGWLWIYDDTARIISVDGDTILYGTETDRGGTDFSIVRR